jgi:predicted CXXCH cytochrome family protein
VIPAAAWQGAEVMGVCVDCHTREGIERQQPLPLARIVENALFEGRTMDDQYCLACHSLPNQSLVFENGERLWLTVTASEIHDSVHGADNPWQPLACVDCHMDMEFPHEPVTAESFREYRLEKYPSCSRCHEPKYESTLDDSHGRALAEGNLEAAVCTDCHGSHNTPIPDEPRERISHTCEQCHSTIFDEYAQSVHGEALLEESNPDVPTCIECHGVHNLTDPKTALFRVRSPQLCATCHADDELMTEYDISTEVFDTYVADFHGTTVTLFEQHSPDVETNKAVCYDCHGVHEIRRPDDPHNGIKANLLETCQQCHPSATANFSDSWTSHYQPSLEHYPLVFLVNWFYRIIIPLTVGGLSMLILTDVYRRVRTPRVRTRGKK